MKKWKTIAKVVVAVLTALLGALGSAAATGVRLWRVGTGIWSQSLFLFIQNAKTQRRRDIILEHRDSEAQRDFNLWTQRLRGSEIKNPCL